MESTLKLHEGSAKLIKLHLINDVDLEALVTREDVKKISDKESVLEPPSLVLRTALQILARV